MGIIKDLKECSTLTEREITIRDYFLSHPEDVLNKTTRELGEATLSSAAAVTRFCQKMGCKGFPEFKMRFLTGVQSGEIYAEVSTENVKIIENENASMMVHKVEDMYVRSIRKSMEETPIEELIRAAAVLTKAAYIDFYASDLNISICEYACSQFVHCGKIANTYQAQNVQQLTALSADRTHAAVILSHTGSNRRLINVANILQSRKVPVIAVCRSKDVPLAKAADHVLVAQSFEGTAGHYDEMWSLKYSTSAKYMLDVLFGLVFSRSFEESMELNRRYEHAGEAFWEIEEHSSL